jgi:hypothetical protein
LRKSRSEGKKTIESSAYPWFPFRWFLRKGGVGFDESEKNKCNCFLVLIFRILYTRGVVVFATNNNISMAVRTKRRNRCKEQKSMVWGCKDVLEVVVVNKERERNVAQKL